MKTTSSLILMALLAFAGCSSKTVNSIEPAHPVAVRQMITDKRIITDKSLNKAVWPIGINEATGPGGFLKIQLEVQNVTNSRKLFTYRIEWFDGDGMMIDLPTLTAKPWSLEGKEIASLTAVAPTPLAKDFRITFLAPVN